MPFCGHTHASGRHPHTCRSNSFHRSGTHHV
jgi:hypothetical protein